MQVRIYIFILCSMYHVNCSRILAVFPTPSVSHQVVFRPIMQELATRGHDVVVITTDPAFPKGKTPQNLTEINVHDVAYNTWNKMLSSKIMGIRNDVYSQIRVIYEAVAESFAAEISVDEVKDIINKRNGEFDLLITEACARPALAFSHIYKVPVIEMSSFGVVAFNDHYVGSALHPLLYPTPWDERLYNLTKWEKIVKLWNYRSFKYYFNKNIGDFENRIIKKNFGSDVPTVEELAKNIHLLMLNVHPQWIDNQPSPPNVIFMGGVYQKPKEGLSQELQSYLDSSKTGVIYVSFGSNVIPSALESNSILAFLTALSKLPYDILLKWDLDTLPIYAPNIKIYKWFPQADVLSHPKVKVFITQGGLQSTDEAITNGVPLIGIPLFADQWYNVEKYVHHRIGMKLDFLSISEQKIKDAVEELISNDSYRANIINFHALMQDQPQPPLERAVWWIEHVLRHGSASHMRAPSANMSLAEYMELDLILTVFTVLCTILCVLVYIIYSMLCRILNITFKTFKVKKS